MLLWYTTASIMRYLMVFMLFGIQCAAAIIYRGNYISLYVNSSATSIFLKGNNNDASIRGRFLFIGDQFPVTNTYNVTVELLHVNQTTLCLQPLYRVMYGECPRIRTGAIIACRVKRSWHYENATQLTDPNVEIIFKMNNTKVEDAGIYLLVVQLDYTSLFDIFFVSLNVYPKQDTSNEDVNYFPPVYSPSHILNTFKICHKFPVHNGMEQSILQHIVTSDVDTETENLSWQKDDLGSTQKPRKNFNPDVKVNVTHETRKTLMESSADVFMIAVPITASLLVILAIIIVVTVGIYRRRSSEKRKIYRPKRTKEQASTEKRERSESDVLLEAAVARLETIQEENPPHSVINPFTK
ncbi:glycoprotein I [Cercopithecine alphaherpesvirus 9]|uniref:Envelope glycoprotein I n=2 Tax=Cercopithecine herpesvirus 9 (strain DHV) TaxID=36348 RepID=GI_CHV9D|nr:envelope glycoprotein I [Cercopithecine alphaherpesvirus 9]Q04547.1 RecName: Full=Envelope glycoprotein I; AltName: Full=Membrane glycoprotein 1; Flags: Precursor [Cercopithecine herpesvirus 9 (strain DHV)]AAA47888.1 membrane glycoprotein [Cercopithecine alphaherpesvirus 9]AAG27242.1 glycoprotein I [Cercopithecine alphaherpesvirus 9]